MAATLILDRVNTLVAERQFSAAAAALIDAAAQCDAPALIELAHWRIAGNIIQRNLPLARALFRRAAAQGSLEAALLHASFLANGAGGTADWRSAVEEIRGLARISPEAAKQWRILQTMEIDPEGKPTRSLTPQRLCDTPLVDMCPGFVTAEECDHLASIAAPILQPSVVVDPQTGRMIPHPVRTSDTAAFGVYSEDLVVNAINRRIAALSGTLAAQGEPLQVLRYRNGGEYRPHFDALPNERNQRTLTVIVYLSDDYAGGETVFPRTGLTFRGRKGDALLFRNVTDDGRPDPLALHAGLPVTRGTKLIATRWIRQKTFTFPPPRPLLDM